MRRVTPLDTAEVTTRPRSHRSAGCSDLRLAQSVLEITEDQFGDRQRRCQSWRLDPEQVHQPRHAVILRAGDHEIGLAFALAGQFWPDAAIIRYQRAVGQARPIGADALVETVGATW